MRRRRAGLSFPGRHHSPCPKGPCAPRPRSARITAVGTKVDSLRPRITLHRLLPLRDSATVQPPSRPPPLQPELFAARAPTGALKQVSNQERTDNFASPPHARRNKPAPAKPGSKPGFFSPTADPGHALRQNPALPSGVSDRSPRAPLVGHMAEPVFLGLTAPCEAVLHPYGFKIREPSQIVNH